MIGSDSEDDDDEEEGSVTVQGVSIPMKQEKVKEDYRLASRPKAVRAKDVTHTSMLPSSLDDLMNDNGKQKVHPSDPFGRSLTSLKHSNRPDDDDDEFCVVVTNDGKVVVKEKEVDTMSLVTFSKDNKRTLDELDVSEPTLKVIPKEINNKRRKLNLKEPGVEYRSKKAGGDVWKKGMMEPHAFIPLDARLFSKKHYKEAVDHFGVVVKNGKKSSKQKDKEAALRNRRRK